VVTFTVKNGIPVATRTRQQLPNWTYRNKKYSSLLNSSSGSNQLWLQEIPLLGSWDKKYGQNYFHTARYLANNNQEKPPVVLPDLMDFPRLIWPRFFLVVQNMIYTYIIRTYMDEEFDIQEFDRGARQALSIVSQKLASGKLDELEGLVDTRILAEISQKLGTFSVFQRELLAVDVKDIFFSFPHRIGVIMPDQEPPRDPFARSAVNTEDNAGSRPPQTRYVEITVVFHILRGFLEKSKESQNFSIRHFINSEDRNNVMVCNYRFFRDFTKGVQNPTWIINMMNHFLPADHK